MISGSLITQARRSSSRPWPFSTALAWPWCAGSRGAKSARRASAQMARTSSCSARSAGRATISLALSATATCPSTSPRWSAQALTRCSAALPLARSCERRSVLPSAASARAAVAGATARTQPANAASNAAGSRAAKTRPKVSWLGMPLGRARKVRRQPSRARPNVAMSVQPSPPHRMAHRPMVRMSMSGCARVRATRGSGSAPKCRLILSVGRARSAPPRAATLVGARHSPTPQI